MKYTKGEAISIKGSEIMSIDFDIQNLGPSRMPASLAIFQIPMFLSNGNLLFTDNDIEVKTATFYSSLVIRFGLIVHLKQIHFGERNK